MTRTHEFFASLPIGKKGEADFKLRHPGVEYHKSGGLHADFFIKRDGAKLELKTDAQGLKTGNLFVELDAMRYGKGWSRSGVYQAIKNGCLFLVYQTLDGTEYWFVPEVLRDVGEAYRRERGELYRVVRNEDPDTGEPYWAGGFKMPIAELRKICVPSPLLEGE